MKTILNKLYAGELFEAEKISDNASNFEKNRRLDKEEALYLSLMKSFSKEQVTLFNEWEHLHNETWCEETEAAYHRGFKIGALLAIEAHRIDW